MSNWVPWPIWKKQHPFPWANNTGSPTGRAQLVVNQEELIELERETRQELQRLLDEWDALIAANETLKSAVEAIAVARARLQAIEAARDNSDWDNPGGGRR